MNKFFSAEPVVGAGETFNACVSGLVDIAKEYVHKTHKANAITNSVNSPIMSERNAFFSTFENNKDYMDKNAILVKNILKYSVSDIDYVDVENPETMKNPMLKKDTSFQNKFYAIMSMALPSVISGIVAFNYAGFGETRDTAFGDTAKFEVPSSQLFVVNRSVAGKRHGAIQRLYGNEIIVPTQDYDITIGIDWFKLVTGRVDLGEWMFKIANSFAHDIGYRVYKEIDDSYAGLPAALKLGGFTDSNFITMSNRVKAANGDAPVYVAGTQLALSSVVPSNDGLLYAGGDALLNAGYLGTYKGTNLVLIPTSINKSTVHSAGTFSLLGDDTRLYFMPLGGDRPVKIVMEGNALQIESSSDSTADRELVISVKHRYGVKVATSAWYGIMDMI